jgi:hypothetical protein
MNNYEMTNENAAIINKALRDRVVELSKQIRVANDMIRKISYQVMTERYNTKDLNLMMQTKSICHDAVEKLSKEIKQIDEIIIPLHTTDFTVIYFDETTAWTEENKQCMSASYDADFVKASLGNAEEPDERQKEFLDSIGVAITHPEDTDQIENV